MGVAPDLAMLEYISRTRLDLIRPPTTKDRIEAVQGRHISEYGGLQITTLPSPGSKVWARDYRGGVSRWVEAVVKETLGSRRLKLFVPSINHYSIGFVTVHRPSPVVHQVHMPGQSVTGGRENNVIDDLQGTEVREDDTNELQLGYVRTVEAKWERSTCKRQQNHCVDPLKTKALPKD